MRWIALVLSVTVPMAALGFGLGGIPGAILGAVVATCFLLFAALIGERSIVNLFPIRSELIRYNPRALIVADPAPWAIAFRSAGSRGTILVSQGLIAVLDEDEIAWVIETAKRRLQSRRILLQTLCALLCAWIIRVTPHGWVDWLGRKGRSPGSPQDLGAGALIHFLALWPLLRFYDRVARAPLHWKGADATISTNASHKIRQVHEIWKEQTLPGLSALSLLE